MPRRQEQRQAARRRVQALRRHGQARLLLAHDARGSRLRHPDQGGELQLVGRGENIAAGQDSAEAVMRDWMNSKGHRDNILNCSFVDLGVGLAYQIKNNRKYPYWTQDFGTPAKR
ncbi:CAP domain-containing protein [Dactylosporangium darangshiense]|uniref:CAP domain-containing protein n=1 Tax=Dactylosporangium darangshiense TaxID=579108 RepID=UPI00363CD349